MKVGFFKRFIAYLIDAMIITMITSIISVSFTSSKYEDTYKEYEELTKNYMNEEVTIEEYQEQIKPIYYDLQKSSVLVSGVSVLTSFAYFIIFQYMNKGQTIGKKLIKIKVISQDGKDVSFVSVLIRSLFINSILSSLFGIVFLYLLDKNSYYNVTSIISTIEMIFLFVTTLFILYRKDKRGLHDILAKTEVIEERGV